MCKELRYIIKYIIRDAFFGHRDLQTVELHEALWQNVFRGYYEGWKAPLGLRLASDGKYTEQDNM